MKQFEKRSWVEINLDALCSNYEKIREHIGKSSEVMAIVKGNAYGHGDVMVSKALQEQGCTWFGVSNIREGIHLREQGIKGHILNLGYLPLDWVAKAVEYNITQTIINADHGKSLQQELKTQNKTLTCHLKIDTGMSRLGVDIVQKDKLEEIEHLLTLSQLKIEGIFTHFSVADSLSKEDIAFTKEQFHIFSALLSTLEKKGHKFLYRHCCNSAGILQYPQYALDLVRPGTILYGLSPSDTVTAEKGEFSQLLSLQSIISSIKTLEENRYLSYGRNRKTTTVTKVATVPIGYADGYPRAPFLEKKVEVKGMLCPVLGNVCMDQILVDVSAVPKVGVGDEVVVISREGEHSIHEIGKNLSSIDIELSCGLGKRLPRVYTKNKTIVEVVEYE